MTASGIYSAQVLNNHLWSELFEETAVTVFVNFVLEVCGLQKD